MGGLDGILSGLVLVLVTPIIIAILIINIIHITVSVPLVFCSPVTHLTSFEKDLILSSGHSFHNATGSASVSDKSGALRWDCRGAEFGRRDSSEIRDAAGDNPRNRLEPVGPWMICCVFVRGDVF